MNSMRRKIRGQGMTEYIIIVALIAIGAIAVYTAFGDVIRGQTGRAAAALSGQAAADATQTAQEGGVAANDAANARTLNDFDRE